MQGTDNDISAKFEVLFEKISCFFDEHPDLSKELIAAKDYYFRQTGKIGVNDNEFGNRMNAFLLWFIFDFQLPLTRSAPIDLYLEHCRENGLQGDFEILQSQKNHIHSLFYFVKEKHDQIIIKDLYTKQKHGISASRVLVGQEKDAFFETRLFEFEGKRYFANFFIYHPVIIRKDIKRQVKLIRKKKESIKPFLLKLQSYHTKWQRYRNINIESIYHFNKSVPEAK